MGKQRDRRAYNLVCRGNRKRLRHLLGKHKALKTSNSAMLVFAALGHNAGMLRWLLHRGVSPDCRYGSADGNTPLMSAVANDDLESTRLLLEFGADPNAINSDQENPLGYAVTWQSVQSIKLLVDAGADINDTVDSGPRRTQLDWAELSKLSEGIEVLRSLGAKRFMELQSETDQQ